MDLSNPHLKKLENDIFHHLGFSVNSCKLKEEFQDVKFVCLSGSDGRVSNFAHFINDQLKLVNSDEIKNLCKTDRYVLYKVGPVLAASHGMGTPSASILLQEVFKLLHYAEATDVVFFRLGTSGGIGLEEGTVVISSKVLNGIFEPNYTQVVLGQVIKHSTGFNQQLIEEIQSLSFGEGHPFKVEVGTTMCCDCFYEGQGRLDGAFCSFSKDDKMAFLNKAYDKGVKNMEMESTVFSALCLRAGVKAAIICVTLVNRLEGDQIKISKEKCSQFQKRPWEICLRYIQSKLSVGNV